MITIISKTFTDKEDPCSSAAYLGFISELNGIILVNAVNKLKRPSSEILNYAIPIEKTSEKCDVILAPQMLSVELNFRIFL